jgi:stearoyl-CoA desaturase (Delta-9 desaturase)
VTVTAIPIETEEVPLKRYQFNEKRPLGELNWGNIVAMSLLHLGALFAVGHYLIRWDLPSWESIWLTAALYVFCGYGISMGYHRLFTHGSYETSRVMKAILYAAAGLTIEGPAGHWVPTHWYHHEMSDRPGDPHSPYQYPGLKGVLWAHVGWLFYKVHQPAEVADKRQWIYRGMPRLQTRYYWVFIVASFAVPLWIAGWDGLLVAGFLRVVTFLHFTWSINSLCHAVGETVAVRYRTESGAIRIRKQGDGSRNVWWLALQTLGEAYHALHHLFDWVAYHGWGKGALDPTKWLLIVLEKLHLVWDVKKPLTDYELTEDDFKLKPDSLILAHQAHKEQKAKAKQALAA